MPRVVAPVRHWLVKTEASAYSILDLERDGATLWDGIRNYQARNFLRAMRKGDLCIVYHSNADPPGAAGIAKVTGPARPDATAWDRKDSHFDARSTPERSLWDAIPVAFVEAFADLLPLDAIRDDARLHGLMLTSGKAMRLSVQPLERNHFLRLAHLGRTHGATAAHPVEGPRSAQAAPSRRRNARRVVAGRLT